LPARLILYRLYAFLEQSIVDHAWDRCSSDHTRTRPMEENRVVGSIRPAFLEQRTCARLCWARARPQQMKRAALGRPLSLALPCLASPCPRGSVCPLAASEANPRMGCSRHFVGQPLTDTSAGQNNSTTEAAERQFGRPPLRGSTVRRISNELGCACGRCDPPGRGTFGF
jgi:hypothetical protein